MSVIIFVVLLWVSQIMIGVIIGVKFQQWTINKQIKKSKGKQEETPFFKGYKPNFYLKKK